MKTFKEFLIKNNACYEGRKFVGALTDTELKEIGLTSQIDCTIENTVATIQRGDWLLWLALMVDVPLRVLTLAKARCVKTVIHLIKNQRSIDTVLVAEKFGLGQCTKEQLDKAVDDAYASFVGYGAAYSAAYAIEAAKISNLKETADICREILGQIIVDKVNLMLK